MNINMIKPPQIQIIEQKLYVLEFATDHI